MSEKTDLDMRLEQYGVTARGQIAREWSIGEIAGYAAAVGAGLAIAGSADAAIIYSGVQNLTVQIDPTAQAPLFTTVTYKFQTTNGGISTGVRTTNNSFKSYNANTFKMGGSGIGMEAIFLGLAQRASGTSATSRGAVNTNVQSFGKYVGGVVLHGTQSSTQSSSSLNPRFFAVSTQSGKKTAFLATSQTIGSNLAGTSGSGTGKMRLNEIEKRIINGTSTQPLLRSYTANGSHFKLVSSFNTTKGYIPTGVTGIVGVKLANGDYGWIRLRVDDLGPNQPFKQALSSYYGAQPIGDGQGYPDKLTVIDWAYNSTPGASIQAGDEGQTIPEPPTLALLAAGAVGLAAFRRRKAGRAH